MPDAKRNKRIPSDDHKLFRPNNHGCERVGLAGNHFDVASRYNTFERDYHQALTPFTVKRMANGDSQQFDSEVKLDGSEDSTEANGKLTKVGCQQGCLFSLIRWSDVAISSNFLSDIG